MKEDRGVVYLIGAGPGNPKLLTLRAVELLQQAEYAIYDALVNPEVLQWLPENAEVVYGGKRSSQHAIPQDELNRTLVDKAKQGKCVVRLKGGDPFLFGRGGEEAEALAAADIPFEVVPGITSIAAAPAFSGIPLTHRDFCSSFTVITGHEDPEKPDSRLNWKHLAQRGGTLVVLMGVEKIEQISKALIDHGMSRETPVALVRWGTTGQQRSVEGTLSTISDVVREQQFSAPAVAVIGEVVTLRQRLNWFERLPLHGQRIVVTRTRKQASQLSDRLARLGADVMEIPTIRVTRPSDGELLKDALLGLHSYDWIVFTSPNGVTEFFSYFFELFEDIRDFGGMKIATIGPATTRKLAEYRLKVDVTPKEYLSSRLVEAMTEHESLENLKVLLMRAEKANPELPRALESEGAIVDDVACYRTVIETADPTGAATRFQEIGADWITFTSASTAENFHERFNLPQVQEQFPGTKLVSIGPETSKAVRHAGSEPTVEAETHTIDGMIEALKQHISNEVTKPASPPEDSVAI